MRGLSVEALYPKNEQESGGDPGGKKRQVV